METIFNYLSSQIDWLIVIIVIALGEIGKRFWKSEKPNAFWKVLIITLPVVVAMAYYSKIEFKVAFASYLLAYWLYPAFVKGILNVIGGLGSLSRDAYDPNGDQPNPDHEEH